PPGKFCGTAEPTAYHQATAQEMPSGFSADDEGEVGRAPRPDSARIQIEITVRPAQPKEDETFEVTARLVNGGDSDVEVSKIEESAVRASGGFQPVAGIALPTTVSVGGAANIYRYTGVLRGGSTYFKELRVTDSLGDSWKSSLRLLPCPRGQSFPASSGAASRRGASIAAMRIAMPAAVLNGGASRRMGRPKGALPYGASTLLDYQTTRLAALFDEVLVVAKQAPDYAAGPARVV